MANLKQSKKRVIQDIKKRKNNKIKKTSIKNYIKKFLNLINLKKADNINESFNFLKSKLDKAVNNKTFKKNKSIRLKNKFYLKAKSLM